MDVEESKLTELEKDLVEGLDGFLGDLKADVDIPAKYTCRRVVLDLQPRAYTAEEVKATRALLQISQALFAQFLGVSPKTVHAWERGNPPSDIACRFMDEIQRDPDYWRRRLSQVAEVRTSA
ncbi:MAG: helix-turn-helix domain-containing protein [Pirellulales bacterium]|nr:helix-turn-helix domain-containing protein [Planctomycetales bacterium]